MFYPRYYEMLSAATEDWCNTVLGVDYRTMHGDWKRAVPAVRVNGDFFAPSHLGDLLTIRVVPLLLGNSSCSLKVDILSSGEERARFELVLVWMDLETMRAVQWPSEIRKAIEAQLAMAS